MVIKGRIWHMLKDVKKEQDMMDNDMMDNDMMDNGDPLVSAIRQAREDISELKDTIEELSESIMYLRDMIGDIKRQKLEIYDDHVTLYKR